MGAKENKILVHICCVACFSYVHRVLDSKGYEIVGYFYNPQIHGKAEYLRRKRDVETYCREEEIELVIPEYDVQDFFEPILPMQDKNSIKYIKDKKRWRTKRCQRCYKIVLSNTLKEAQKREVKVFTTTFLTTPYKDHDEIWNLGLEYEREDKVQFFYDDFRKGYWNGRNHARSRRMTMPSYCGCVYSSEEGVLE